MIVLIGADRLSNWKPTRKKIYTQFVSVPSVGTRVRNKLTGEEYIVTVDRQILVCGTFGEAQVLSIKDFMTAYRTMSSGVVSLERLRELANASPTRAVGLAGWMKVKSRPGKEKYWDMHIPCKYEDIVYETSGQCIVANKKGMKHGKGDYLVCLDSDGFPNRTPARVINGAIFPMMYTMNNFSQQ